MPKETFFNLDEEKKQRIIEASINEFSDYSYNEVKLSKIIKAAKIPRGSFYQYFIDKLDLYKYVFNLIGESKLEFMKDLLSNHDKMPFVTLFEELYKRGVKFALSDPRYVRISKNLLLSGEELISEIVGDNLNVAKQYYIDYIETDKKLGRIRKDIDSELLAELVVKFTTNIAFDEIQNNEEFNLEHMLEKSIKIINILRKGIE